MWQPLWRLPLIFVSVLLLTLLWVGEQRGRKERRRGIRQQQQAALVTSWFFLGVYTCRGEDARAGPRKRREASVCARSSGRLSLPRVGRPERGRKGAARSEAHTSELQSQFHLVRRLLL